MLGTSKLVAFVATSDPDRARTFYKDALGLRPVSDDRFALVFDANGTHLRIQKVDAVSPPAFTVLGWEVADVAETIAGLVARGVVLERYDFMKQDGLGVWTSPSGAKVAWFKDPDGNLLSVTQMKPS